MPRVNTPRYRGSVSERLAAAAADSLIGRAPERAQLTDLITPDGPAAVFVYGPGGIGKTTLVNGTLAALPLKIVALDARQMEPTVPGALAALGGALGVPAPSSAAAAAQMISDAGADVLVIDSFERLNLLDGWVRNDLVSSLSASVTVLLVGRRGPNVAWRTAPGWRTLLAELVVGPLTAPDVDLLLAAHGVGGDDAAADSHLRPGAPPGGRGRSRGARAPARASARVRGAGGGGRGTFRGDPRRPAAGGAEHRRGCLRPASGDHAVVGRGRRPAGRRQCLADAARLAVHVHDGLRPGTIRSRRAGHARGARAA